MILKSLKLESYRNYSSCDLTLSPGINIFFGDNAQGKTNILEAVYLSATTKSHKGSKDKEIIAFDKEESHIRSVWDKDGMEYRVDMHLRKNKGKGIAINGQGIKKSSQLLGLCSVVFFSPEDLSIIKEGPVERRRFMDMELCQMDASYLYNFTQYNKVVNQRNSLLKEMAFQDQMKDVLSVWNNQLVSYGKKIIERRQKYNEDLNLIINQIHSDLSGKKEDIKVLYHPNTTIESFEEDMRRNEERDLRFKMTHTGPHKDDLIFEVNGVDIRKFGSQGQQRTAALSLKLSEIEMIKRMKHDNPILLLDDVLSELDSSRQNFLLSRLGNIQTLVTCTGLDEFVKERIRMDQIYQVTNGVIKDYK